MTKTEKQILIDNANLCFVCAELAMRFADQLRERKARHEVKMYLKPLHTASQILTTKLRRAFKLMDEHYSKDDIEETFDQICDKYEELILNFAEANHFEVGDSGWAKLENSGMEKVIEIE